MTSHSSADAQELIQVLRAALNVTPDALPLHKHLAGLLMQSGAYPDAVEVYKQALKLSPDNVEIKSNLAEAYHLTDQNNIALVILEELLQHQDVEPFIYLLSARVYFALGSITKAAAMYRHAVTSNPALADDSLQRQLTAAMPETSSQGSGDNRVFVTVGEETQDLVDYIERPKISFKDVGGMNELKEEIRLKIIYPLTHPEIYQAYGKSTGGGILMYGPPGCGKTYLARATAGEVDAHFLAVGLHDVLDMYIGQSEKKLHAIFELARHNPPCVLFFDEVDALGAKRSDLRHSSVKQTINQFLSELDGVSASNEGVLVLAATNAPWHLDAALRRPGRFDRVLFVPPPDTAARAAIFHLLLQDKPISDINYAKIARNTVGFSGADLKGIVDQVVENKLQEAMRTGIPAAIHTHELLEVVKQARITTQEWFETARNYAIYANQSGLYNDVLSYMKIK
jgi:ATP-dependent 26S proteasome regulatory subunit